MKKQKLCLKNFRNSESDIIATLNGDCNLDRLPCYFIANSGLNACLSLTASVKTSNSL